LLKATEICPKLPTATESKGHGNYQKLWHYGALWARVSVSGQEREQVYSFIPEVPGFWRFQ